MWQTLWVPNRVLALTLALLVPAAALAGVDWVEVYKLFIRARTG